MAESHSCCHRFSDAQPEPSSVLERFTYTLPTPTTRQSAAPSPGWCLAKLLSHSDRADANACWARVTPSPVRLTPAALNAACTDAKFDAGPNEPVLLSRYCQNMPMLSLPPDPVPEPEPPSANAAGATMPPTNVAAAATAATNLFPVGRPGLRRPLPKNPIRTLLLTMLNMFRALMARHPCNHPRGDSCEEKRKKSIPLYRHTEIGTYRHQQQAAKGAHSP